MLGYVMRRGPRKDRPAVGSVPMPADLRARLLPWIDVDDVGEDGFWLWLGTILPLLPDPDRASESEPPHGRFPRPEPGLAHAMTDCARERARLTVMCDALEAQNRRLLRRLKALEAAVRAFSSAGYPVRLPPVDPEAGNDGA